MKWKTPTNWALFSAHLKQFLAVNVLQSAEGYVCRLCGLVTKHRFSIRRHAAERHLNPAGLRYQCPRCGAVYKTRNTFTSHCYTNHSELKGIDFDKCIVADPETLKYTNDFN